MREISIAKVITAKRKEKGITQDKLAEYVGVSKASVSKWETAQSYPDITLLPQLATYFNISIDELIGYLPQMTKKDIKKTYQRLAEDFSNKPFDDVLDQCRAIIKKYFSCFPLLLQIAKLYVNHFVLATERGKQEELLQEAIDLCVRIKKESDDIWIAKQANSLEVLCHIILNQPLEVAALSSKFDNIYNLSDEEAKSTSVLGKYVRAYYLKEMGEHPSANYLKELNRPIFILQGEKDFHVSVEKDFNGYKRILGDRTNVTYKLYLNLNHAFMPFVYGEIRKAKKEYKVAQHVDQQVINDIADWIHSVSE
ncbi:helix-turn-helix domain-containing protein [Lysinibacillus sp. NPDC056185]|uniref:helix-turn-helix domain-containing protein n=1 Tax=Lysinibacillus sp. NPDC056185 TaxID=3345739 RepID=UPI0039EEFEA0